MSANGLAVVAGALLLMSPGAATASPLSDRAAASTKTPSAPAAQTSAAKPTPRVIDPPLGNPVPGGRTPAPAKAEAAPAARSPSLAEVVERIDRILREGAAPKQEGAAPQQGRPSVRPARNSVRTAAAPRGPSRRAAGRPAGRDITLAWPDARPQRSTGLQLRWPADLDPRRQPTRPLGVRLSWPSSADFR